MDDPILSALTEARQLLERLVSVTESVETPGRDRGGASDRVTICVVRGDTDPAFARVETDDHD